jgi:hypothetical protein
MTTILFTTTGYNSWIVPADWNNSNNCFEAIGGGAGGVTLPTGGGGGAYCRSNNLSTLVPGHTVYIYVGKGGVTPAASTNGANGENTWINIVSNAAPTLSNQGVKAGGGGGGIGTGTPGPKGVGIVGQFMANGGAGSDTDNHHGGGGGGAGGPHGVGRDGFMNASTGWAQGGNGDFGYGGAGGFSTQDYSAINNGVNGANNGSGGGGAHDNYGYTYNGAQGVLPRGMYGYGGVGGLYGGGGGSSVGGSTGAQGIAKITYTPYVIPPPPVEPPPTPNTPPPNPPPPCVPSGFETATPAQVYWSYGQWTDPWNNVSAAHYDSNYQQLVNLSGDDDSNTFDIQYNSTSPWNFSNEKENFYRDYPRVWKSRSNELLEDAGKRSVWMRHRALIGDADCVPNIDPASGYVTLLSNMLFMDEETYGYRLSYSNNTNYFKPGDLIVQNIDGSKYATGKVYMMDTQYIYVNIPVGPFLPGYDVYHAYNTAINAHVTSSVEIDEKYSANVFPGQSRYICKSTILEDGMDAEDLQCFATAYRPSNTNFKVYGKVKSAADPGKYTDRVWSRLAESNNTATSYSSLTNNKDYINVKYKLPVSVFLYGNMESCGCNSETLEVTVPSVNRFVAGDYIYLTSPATGTFNIRRIINIPNNDTLMISSFPSFSNTANLNIGVIPGLEHPTAAFTYDQTGVARYVTSDDVSFDMFNQFAVKIVPVSDNPVVCPVMTEFRAVASQAAGGL